MIPAPKSSAGARPLAALQSRLDIVDGPAFAGRYHPDAAVVRGADQRVRAHIVVDPDQFQIGVRLPVEGDVEIARKDPPLRPVVELDDMALGVGLDLHGNPVLDKALGTNPFAWISSDLHRPAAGRLVADRAGAV